MRNVDDYIDAAKGRIGVSSDRKLAIQLGLTHSVISQIRTRKMPPSEDIIMRLAQAAGINASEAILELNIWRSRSTAAKSVYTDILKGVKRTAASLLCAAFIGLSPLSSLDKAQAAGLSTGTPSPAPIYIMESFYFYPCAFRALGLLCGGTVGCAVSAVVSKSGVAPNIGREKTMSSLRIRLLCLVVGGALPGAAIAATVTTVTTDGVTIYGETYFADLPDSAPLVLLFHQAGSNGRGEYGAAIAPWLNRNGFRAIAWDQRSGGNRFGNENRTVAALKAGVPDGFCDAYADLSAALSFARAAFGRQKIIVWGSSYSAALVFQLAAKNPQAITAVIGFSPASGGALATCRAGDYLPDLKPKAMMLRPGTEMKRSATRRQFSLFTKQGVTAKVINMGVHGASMLVDARTRHTMWSARDLVMRWLKDVTGEK